MLKRTPGGWLRVLGWLHAGVGAVLYRRPLAEIARHRVVATVPDFGDRSTAYWFLAAAPLLWVAGRLLDAAEEAGDDGAQRAAGAVLAATGLAGGIAMPVNGIWGVAAVGVAVLRRTRRRP